MNQVIVGYGEIGKAVYEVLEDDCGIIEYNNLYEILDMKQFQKFILDPPNGKIGGHCVIPNAKLLDEQYPDPLLKMLKEYE